jgi:hypothetical protein
MDDFAYLQTDWRRQQKIYMHLLVQAQVLYAVSKKFNKG